MIPGNHRLIVVLGMANSGTTILTHLLRQHPRIQLICHEKSNLLENDWMTGHKEDEIGKALSCHPRRRLLIKKPWLEVYHADWLLKTMPHARFLYCYRDFSAIVTSWHKPGQEIVTRMKEDGFSDPKDFYQFCRHRSRRFMQSVRHVREVYHSSLVADPQQVLSSVTHWLALKPPTFVYDISDVGYDKDIKSKLTPKRG